MCFLVGTATKIEDQLLVQKGTLQDITHKCSRALPAYVASFRAPKGRSSGTRLCSGHCFKHVVSCLLQEINHFGQTYAKKPIAPVGVRASLNLGYTTVSTAAQNRLIETAKLIPTSASCQLIGSHADRRRTYRGGKGGKLRRST